MFTQFLASVKFQYEMFVLTMCLFRAWYRVSKKHSARAKHKVNAVRDGKKNKWVGEISDSVAKRLQYYRRGDVRLYVLGTGSTGRMA